ncbi:MAG: class II aldolase/adducin family protein [Haloarculaceae archaeon]
MYEDAKERVLQASLDLMSNGFVRNTGSSGNVSLRADDDAIVITPSHVRYDTMETDDLVVIDTDGAVVESPAGYDPSSETSTHLLVHDAAAGDAVVHSHPMTAVSLAQELDEIPPVYLGQAYFVGGAVPAVDYVQTGSEEMGETISGVLSESPAVVIRHHGLFAVGDDLDEAIERTFAVEENAEIYFKADRVGEPTPMDPADVEAADQG